jgi:uncharacterized protein (TIGR00661 family)
MRILYGIQGTGQGHLTRALEFLPRLRQYGMVDVLMSGGSSLAARIVPRYEFEGCTLSYNDDGKIAMLDTARRLKPIQLLRDIYGFEIGQYDLVVTDYEPISAWAARKAGIPSVQLSHQAAFASKAVPRPKSKKRWQEAILRWFAPTDFQVGFHYQCYDVWIEPPIIRREIQQLDRMSGHRVTVYLPGVDHKKVAGLLAQIPEVRWHLFAPVAQRAYREGTVVVNPVDRTLFTQSLERSFAVLCNAGFETTAETLYLGKKLMVFPIRGQYEQQCNAEALKQLNVPVLSAWDEQQIPKIRSWIQSAHYPTPVPAADPDAIVRRIMQLALKGKGKVNVYGAQHVVNSHPLSGSGVQVQAS